MSSTSYSVDIVGLLVDIKVGVHFILTTIPQLILLGGELNPVDNTSIEILSSGIRMQPKNQGNKEVTISFANVVARENNRGSVSAAQKASRKSKASPSRTRAITRARVVGDAKVIDNSGTSASTSKLLDRNRGTKRKAVDIDTTSSPCKLVLGPRKLRKRA